MTKKDYELIAGAINQTLSDVIDSADVEIISLQLANTLERENPRFDKYKFLKACGIED